MFGRLTLAGNSDDRRTFILGELGPRISEGDQSFNRALKHGDSVSEKERIIVMFMKGKKRTK